MPKPKLRAVRDIHRNAGAIRLARDVCRDLEDGDAIGVAVVVLKRSGYIATAWEAGANGSHAVHSGAHMLAHRIGRGLT